MQPSVREGIPPRATRLFPNVVPGRVQRAAADVFAPRMRRSMARIATGATLRGTGLSGAGSQQISKFSGLKNAPSTSIVARGSMPKPLTALICRTRKTVTSSRPRRALGDVAEHLVRSPSIRHAELSPQQTAPSGGTQTYQRHVHRPSPEYYRGNAAQHQVPFASSVVSDVQELAHIGSVPRA